LDGAVYKRIIECLGEGSAETGPGVSALLLEFLRVGWPFVYQVLVEAVYLPLVGDTPAAGQIRLCVPTWLTAYIQRVGEIYLVFLQRVAPHR